MRRLSETKRGIFKRFQEREEKVKDYSLPEVVKDKTERLIIAILTELGIDYPIDLIKCPPDVPGVARQGMIEVLPNSSRVLTFKARDKGYLVINPFDVVFEDPIAEEYVTIKYEFDDVENSVDFREDKSVTEVGHWKYRSVTLYDGETMKVTFTNSYRQASAFISYEAELWQL